MGPFTRSATAPDTIVAPAVQKAHWKNQLSMVDWQPSESQVPHVMFPWAGHLVLTYPHETMDIHGLIKDSRLTTAEHFSL